MGEANRASGGEEGEGEAGGGTPRPPAQCACARAGTSSGLARAWLLKIAPVWGSVRGRPGESRAEGGRRLRATRCWRRVLAAACARLPAASGHGEGRWGSGLGAGGAGLGGLPTTGPAGGSGSLGRDAGRPRQGARWPQRHWDRAASGWREAVSRAGGAGAGGVRGGGP